MKKNAEKPSQLSIESPLDRFDVLTESLMPLMAKDSFMGGFNTPVLQVGEADMRFSVFRPDLAGRVHYSPSILCHRLVIKEQGEVSFLAPESEIFLRRNRLEIGENTGKLDELLIAATEYDMAARRLSPSMARELGFCEEFVKNQSKFRRASRFLVKILNIVAD